MESVGLILTENWRNCSQNHSLWEAAQRSEGSLYLEGSKTCSTAKANLLWHWMSAMGLPVPVCQSFWARHPCSPLGNSLPLS